MATCKECLHYEMCVVPNEQGSYYLKADRDCRYFKDKTKYVEQKHGRWKSLGCDEFVCSECFEHYEYPSRKCGYNYCPNCGAKMEE